MPRKILAGFAVALTALTLNLPLHAQSVPAPAEAVEPAAKTAPVESLREKIAALEEKSRVAYEAGKWVPFYTANMKLSQLLPYEPRYLINVVRACGQLDRKSTAYHYMHQLQQQGFTYDFNSTDDTLKIRDTEAYQYINKMLVDAGNPAGEGSVMFKLPGNPKDYSAIAWDESRDRFLVGTLKDGALMAVSGEGETTELLKASNENGIRSITGLAVDAGSNRLWLSTAATPAFSAYSMEDKGHGALLELDLKTLEVLGRFSVPDDGLEHEPGSVVVTDDKHVYLIDRATPIVYRKAPESDQLEAFFANPELLGLTDLAVTPDNSRLFISDAGKGLMVIDPNTVQAAMLTGPETLNLGGIGSADYSDGKLFLVQGGFAPQRVIRLELDGTGVAVESVGPMAIGLSEFNRPALGTIKGDSLFYIANTGASEDSGAIVMSTRLDAAFEVEPPTIQELQEAIKSKTQ